MLIAVIFLKSTCSFAEDSNRSLIEQEMEQAQANKEMSERAMAYYTRYLSADKKIRKTIDMLLDGCSCGLNEDNECDNTTQCNIEFDLKCTDTCIDRCRSYYCGNELTSQFSVAVPALSTEVTVTCTAKDNYEGISEVNATAYMTNLLFGGEYSVGN